MPDKTLTGDALTPALLASLSGRRVRLDLPDGRSVMGDVVGVEGLTVTAGAVRGTVVAVTVRADAVPVLELRWAEVKRG